MKTLNFKENFPKFGNYYNETIRTKDPYEIFANQKKSTGSIMLRMPCCCGDSDCKNRLNFYYTGLNMYTNSKNLSDDKKVIIQPSPETKKEGMTNNIMWNPTKENVTKFIEFSETVIEAIAFKQELLNGLFATLQVKIKKHNTVKELEIIVRKDETGIRFILFKIRVAFPNVPLLYESTGYHECLGVIATLPTDTDTSKIKNDYADIKNPFFEPVITWVKLLGEANELDLVIINILVILE